MFAIGALVCFFCSVLFQYCALSGACDMVLVRLLLLGTSVRGRHLPFTSPDFRSPPARSEWQPGACVSTAASQAAGIHTYVCVVRAWSSLAKFNARAPTGREEAAAGRERHLARRPARERDRDAATRTQDHIGSAGPTSRALSRSCLRALLAAWSRRADTVTRGRDRAFSRDDGQAGDTWRLHQRPQRTEAATWHTPAAAAAAPARRCGNRYAN